MTENRIWAGFESTSIYVYSYTILELYYVMRNIISLAPDSRDSARSTAPPTMGLATQAMAPAIMSLAVKRCMASRLSASYLEIKLIILRDSVGSE